MGTLVLAARINKNLRNAAECSLDNREAGRKALPHLIISTVWIDLNK